MTLYVIHGVVISAIDFCGCNTGSYNDTRGEMRMSIEFQAYFVFACGVLLLACIGVAASKLPTMCEKAKEHVIVGGISLIFFVVGGIYLLVLSCAGLIDVTPDLILIVQNDFSESDCVIVEYTTKENGEYDNVVAYFPELDESKRITFEEDPDNLEVGKTYRVGYYRLKRDPRITLVRFLYCVDDMNE